MKSHNAISVAKCKGHDHKRINYPNKLAMWKLSYSTIIDSFLSILFHNTEKLFTFILEHVCMYVHVAILHVHVCVNHLCVPYTENQDFC